MCSQDSASSWLSCLAARVMLQQPTMCYGRVVEAHSKPVGSARTAPAPVDRRAWANAMVAARLVRTARMRALLVSECNGHNSFLHIQPAQPDIPFLPDSASFTVREKALEAIRKSPDILATFQNPDAAH